MKKRLVYIYIIAVWSCQTTDDYKETQDGAVGVAGPSVECIDANYPDWRTSSYVLPYTIGESYIVGLSHCGGSFHAFDAPDQYATDFNMTIGTTIRASRSGTVVFIEQSGEDYNFPNNKVVILHTDGTFGQYMHLTQNGASVSVGTTVQQGSIIGLSGATGLAGYPHLHFVVTENGEFEYPYTSIPMNFRNTTENPRELESGVSYEALSY